MSEKTHKQFLDQLDASSDGVEFVKKILEKIGYIVNKPDNERSPSHKDWKEYVDSGDLLMQQVVEVKQLSCSFTCRDDWPFKDKFIVCAKHSFDMKFPKPYLYIYLNKERTFWASLLGSASNAWTVEKRKDGRYKGEDVEQEFYITSPEFVNFFRIDPPSKPIAIKGSEKNEN